MGGAGSRDDEAQARAAEEAREKIRLWLKARKRAEMMGNPCLSPYEQMKVYQKLIRPIEKKELGVCPQDRPDEV